MTVPKKCLFVRENIDFTHEGSLGAQVAQFPHKGGRFPHKGGQFPHKVGQFPHKGAEFPHEGPNFRTRGVDFRTTGADVRTRGHDFRTRGPGGPVGPASFGSDASEVEINECRKFYRFLQVFLDIYQTRRFLEFRTIIVLSV